MTTQVGFGLLPGNIPSTLLASLEPDPVNFVQQVITESGTTQSTTVVAPTPTSGLGGLHPFCRIATGATGLYFSLGTTPNSQTDSTRRWLPVAGVYYISCPAGVKAAISTA
jgi:hypothetical protein